VYIVEIGSKKSRWYTLIVILLPILNQYTFLSMNFMDIFNIFIAIVYLVFSNGRIRIKNGFIPYMLYSLLIMSISMLGLQVYSPVLFFKNILSFIFLTFNLFFVAPNIFDIKYGFKCYANITLISCVIVIIQTLINMVLSLRLVFVAPSLILNYGNGMTGSAFISTVQSYSNYRASAFFLEPAYFAEFCLPFLYLSLFNSEDRLSTKNIVRSLFITISVCLTTSMLGIIGCAIAWLVYVGQMLWTSKRRKLIVLIPIVLGVGLYIYNLDSVQTQIISKLYSAQNLTMSTSLSLRLIRGWYCFNELDLIRQLFGVGYGCVSSFFSQYNITTILDREGIVNSYMNGISLMLCSLGIVGTLLYMIPFVKIIIKNKKVFMLLVCWIILMFTSQAFDTANYFVLMVFIMLISQKTKII
jgi:hypothetical protein